MCQVKIFLELKNLCTALSNCLSICKKGVLGNTRRADCILDFRKKLLSLYFLSFSFKFYVKLCLYITGVINFLDRYFSTILAKYFLIIAAVNMLLDQHLLTCLLDYYLLLARILSPIYKYSYN